MSKMGCGVIVIGALVSILMFNPIPFGVVLLGAILIEKATAVDEEAIREAGRNPDLPPPPTTGIGVVGFIMWSVVWTMIIVIAMVVAIGIVSAGPGGV